MVEWRSRERERGREEVLDGMIILGWTRMQWEQGDEHIPSRRTFCASTTTSHSKMELSISRIIILLNQVPHILRQLGICWTQIMRIAIHIKNGISDIDHFFLSSFPLLKSKTRENVRGVTKIDGVVKCPASESRCVSETLAENIFLIIAAVNVFI